MSVDVEGGFGVAPEAKAVEAAVAFEAVVLPVEQEEQGVVVVAARVGAGVARGEGGEAVGVEEARESAQGDKVLCPPVARPVASDRIAGGEVDERQRAVWTDDDIAWNEVAMAESAIMETAGYLAEVV